MPTTPRTRKSGLDLPDEPSADLPDEPAVASSDPEQVPVHVALNRVQRDIGPVAKERENSEQHFKFRGIDQVIDELHYRLAEHGVMILPTCLERQTGVRVVGQYNKSSNVVWLHMQYTFVGPMGDMLTADMWGEGANFGDKATANAETMAFKYALAQVFTIPFSGMMTDPDGDIVEGTAVDPAEVETTKAALLAASTVEQVRSIVTAHLSVMGVTVQIEGLGEGTLAQLAEYVTAQRTAAPAVEAQPAEAVEPATVEAAQPEPPVPAIPEEERKPLPRAEIERFTLGLDDAVEGRLPGKGGGKRRTGAPYEDRLAYLSAVEKWARAHVPKEQLEDVLLPKLDQAMETVISYINDDQRQAAEAAR